MHSHNIDGTKVECSNLTHCPSVCDCAMGDCNATVTPRRASTAPVYPAAQALAANHAACDNCGNRINGYVCVIPITATGWRDYLCADCLAIGMGVTTEESGYLRRTGALWIDQIFESTDTPPF